jgi:hypothetical protein
MKKITLLILFLFSIGEMNAQIWTLTSCSSATSGSVSYGPMYSTSTVNANNRTAVIYPSSQLVTIAGQTLNSMYFNRTTTTGTMAGTPNFKIYLKEVTSTDFGSTALDWATGITGATLVYDSDPVAIVGSTAGIKQFNFTTNFTYTGTQNLAVFYEYSNTTASSSISWQYDFTSPCVNTTNNTTTKYSNNTTGTLSSTLASTDYRRPIIGFDFVVTCPAPLNLAATNVSTNSVDISWGAGGTETAWQYVVQLAGQGTPSSPTSSTSTSFNVGSLTSNTNYEVYVRSNCGGANGDSYWVGPINFKTLCNPVSAFVENFDTWPTGSVAGLPDCWSKLGTGIAYLTTGANAPMSAPNRIYTNISTTTDLYVLMPPVSNLQANTHRLKFKAYCSTVNKALSVGYFTIPGNVNTYIEIDLLQMPSTSLATTQEFTVIPTTIPAGVSKLVFKPVTGASTTIYIDDVKWEVNSSCVEPTILLASMITNSGATLGWTNGGVETLWDIQYGLTNFALGTGTIVSAVTTNPYVLGGLMFNTQYQFYVRAVCTGPTNSAWSGPFTFKTKCNDMTDYTENFEAWATGTSSPMPDCWGKLGTGTTYVTTGSVAPMSPAKKLYMYASGTIPTEAYAVLPGFSNLQLNTHRLKFKAYATTLTRILEVGYLTDPTDITTFVQIQEINLPGTAATTAQEFTIVPGVLPAGVKFLCFKNPGFPGSTTTLYIDDVIWEPIPSCVEPNFLTSSAITNNSASIGWTQGGTATTWEIEYGAPGFINGAGTVVTANANPFTISTLTANTTYDFYVRAVCSSTESSVWAGSSSFLTQCDDVTNYFENFDSYPTGSANPLGDCFGKGGTGSVYLSTGAVAPMSPSNRIYMYSNGTSNPTTTSFVILPPVSNLQANTHRLKFKGYATSADKIMKVGYLTDAGDVNTFVLIQDVTMAGTAIAATQEYIVIPTGIPANVKNLALYNPAMSLTGSSSTTMYIDDITWEPVPSSAPLCATNVVATPDVACGNFATSIAWDLSIGADGYKLTIGTSAGASDVLNAFNIGNFTNYSFVGNFNTTYYYTIVPYNGFGDATGCTEQTFTTFATGCYCSPVYTTGITSNDLISNVVITGTTLSNNSGTVNSGPYYTYFTGQPNYTADLQQGVTYDLVVTVGSFGSQNVAVWIDFNDDLTFDASEKVGFTTTTIAANGSGTIQIPISCTSQSGLHRMRVRDVYNTTGSAIDPCVSYGYGEAEDYDITIGTVSTPTGNATQTISEGNAVDATIEDIVVSPSVVTWYSTQADALAGTNALVVGTQLVDNSTYYAVNIANGCPSAPFAVTVSVVLSSENFDNASFIVYPNPIENVLNISYKSEISSIKILNLLGQEVLSRNVGSTSTQIDMSGISAGAYIVNVIVDDVTKIIKVMKK